MAASQVESRLVDISADTQDSIALYVGGFERGSVQMPATIEGTQIKYKVSNDNVTYDEVRDDAGTAHGAVTTAGNQIATIPAEVFSSAWLIIEMQTVQTADRTLQIHLAGPA